MTDHNHNDRKAVRAASQSRYQRNLRRRRSPRSEDISRAVLHAVRDTLAQIVNISSGGTGRQVMESILRRTSAELVGRGFDKVEVAKKAMRSLSTPTSAS